MLGFRAYQGQDRFVVAATGGQRGGFFLDSGASDGHRGSNTWVLENDLGWGGICVEPNDVLFDRLRRNRTCVCVNCCIYDRDADVEFFESAEVYGGIVEEYEPAHLAFATAWVREQARPTTYVTKPARTLRSLLRDHGAPRVIDYWSLDTEGSELAILKTFPFSEYVVRFLTVEHNHSPARREIAEFLRSRGFVHAADLGIDDAYAWRGNGATPGRRQRAWRSSVWRGRSGAFATGAGRAPR